MPNRLQVLSLTLMLALVSIGARAERAECEPAVDMIESNDAVNRISECDYRDEGLNGWLANLGGSDEPRSADTAPANITPTSQEAMGEKGFGFKQTVSDPLSLVQARYSIAQQAAARCAPRVANLVTEAYKSDKQGTVLVMQFRCDGESDD